MKKLLYIFFLISISLEARSQNQVNDSVNLSFEFKYNYGLKGPVKEVIININLVVYDIKYSKYHPVSYSEKLLFNSSGYLLKEFVSHNAELFLNEENTYNSNNKLLHKIRYSKELKRQDSFSVPTGNILSYEERYRYDSLGRLLTEHRKTSRHKGFFIYQRLTYKNEKLIKKERLNNHIETSISGYVSCKGDGSWENDEILHYLYNDHGDLEGARIFLDKSHYQNKTPVIKNEFEDYSHLFKMEKEVVFNNNRFSFLIKKMIDAENNEGGANYSKHDIHGNWLKKVYEDNNINRVITREILYY